MSRIQLSLHAGCAVVLIAGMSCALSLGQRSSSPASVTLTDSEQRVEVALDRIRDDSSALRALLYGMPKGADLHSHLSGAVYAETFIREAAEDNICVDPASGSLVRQPLPSSDKAACGTGKVSAVQALKDRNLYDVLINAMSMRGFVATSGATGHDHFFAAFAKFGAIGGGHVDEWLDEVVTRAANQNEQYLELMIAPPSPKTLQAGRGRISGRPATLSCKYS